MPALRAVFALLCALLCVGWARAETLTIAAASDLKFALDEIVADFKQTHTTDTLEVVYGSSGKLQAQIQQGAPYDLFFSADIAFARALAQNGWAASEVTPYALGRVVLWGRPKDGPPLSLASLTDPRIQRIAIANPLHAPYGQRAQEALRASGLWAQVEPKLVYGENVASAAQFVHTGNAQVGLIALALAKSPDLAAEGRYTLISDTLHTPLEQGFIITRRAQNNALARSFADFMGTPAARAVMARYGFTLPAAGARAP